MDNKPDIGFIDTHPKGDSGDDDACRFVHKAILHCATVFQPGMVSLGGDAGLAQLIGQLFALMAAVDIDNAATLGLAGKFEQGGQLLFFVVKVDGGEMKVVTENIHRHHAGPLLFLVHTIQAGGAVANVIEDFVADARRCGRGHGQGGRRVQLQSRLLDKEIVGAKIMTPQTNTVRLVDHKEIDATLAQCTEKLTLA